MGHPNPLVRTIHHLVTGFVVLMCARCTELRLMPWKPKPPGAEQRARAKRARYDTPEWRRLRTQTLAAWRAEYGNWCPGYGVAAHASSDLTVDHVAAGSLELGVAVLCRRCNGAKGNR